MSKSIVKLYLRLFLFLCCSMFLFTAASQVPQVLPFSHSEEMSSTVYHLFEASDRKIWMGTDDGLYCWTGTELKRYYNANFLYEYSSIQEDEQGRIWCLNFSSQLFYLENDSLKLFYDLKDFVSTIFSYSVSHFPKVYITSDSGLLQFDFKSKELSFPLQMEGDSLLLNANDKELRGVFFTNRLISDEHDLFFKHRNSIYRYTNKGKLRLETAINIVGNRKHIPWKSIQLFASDQSVLVINSYKDKVGVWSELKFNSSKRTDSSTFHVVDEDILSYFFDEDNHWCGTNRGIHLFDNEFNKVYDDGILEGEQVSFILKDKEGVVWVSTLRNGVFQIPSSLVLSIKNEADYELSSMLSVEKQGIYFFTEQGLVLQNKGKGLEVIGDIKDNTEGAYFNSFRKELGFAQTSSGYSFLSKSTTKNPFYLDTKSISFIEKGIALVSGSGGVQIRLFEKEKSARLTALKLTHETSINFVKADYFLVNLRGQRSQFNFYDRQDTSAYVSFMDGLFVYSNFEEKEIRYKGNAILASSLVGAKRGGILCSTVEGELLHIDYPKVELIGTFNFGIKKLIDLDKMIYLSSNKGILKYERATKAKDWIKTSDGLPSNRIVDIAYYKDSIYALTSNGLAVFSVDYSYKNTIAPLVGIQAISVNDKDRLVLDRYELSYEKNTIELSYTGVANRSRGSFNFLYRLNGLDSTWRLRSSTEKTVRFNALPPGVYEFQLKVRNEDGVESVLESVQFYIDQAYYQKWWFYSLMVILIVFLVSGVFLIRIRVLNRRNALIADKKEIEKQLSLSQLTALRSQMNPHFIFNALNSIQDYIINNNKELASDYLGLFADLMRKYLLFSNREEISLEEEVESLQMYLDLEQVRFEDSLQCELKLDPKLDVVGTKLPVMLVQPFVENALKHGLLHKKKNRLLKVEFKKRNKGMEILIQDNGVGRAASAQINKLRNKSHQSFASSAIQQRVELLNKQRSFHISIQYSDLEDQFGKAEGTLVRIRLEK
ncbi:MAG: histidine kinase [Flavobacteriales bacterium]|nr:histidine kinase [Flavobacteriales bacterium]